MLEIGLSTTRFLPTEELFRSMAEAGIQNMEVSLSCAAALELDYPWVKALSEQYGVRLWSYHLPFAGPGIDLASPDEAERAYTTDYWCEQIRKGAQIGIERFVAHPGKERKVLDLEAREAEIEQSMRSLRQLAEVAAENGATVAVENLPRTCMGRTSDELLRLVSADSRLRICFDTNHFLAEDVYAAAQKIVDKIVTVHVSDYDHTTERHWLPGEGLIDWQKLYGILTQGGYQGAWMYEVPTPSTRHVQREQELTPADFANNAHQIFRGQTPTPLGKIILNT